MIEFVAFSMIGYCNPPWFCRMFVLTMATLLSYETPAVGFYDLDHLLDCLSHL